MSHFCSNCLKTRKKGESCSVCGKVLGTEFVCIKLTMSSDHFCSRICAEKKVAAARYLPAEAICQKCKYVWNLPKEVKFPISCPRCEAMYAPPGPKFS